MNKNLLGWNTILKYFEEAIAIDFMNISGFNGSGRKTELVLKLQHQQQYYSANITTMLSSTQMMVPSSFVSNSSTPKSAS